MEGPRPPKSFQYQELGSSITGQLTARSTNNIKLYSNPIVTEVSVLDTFYIAEKSFEKAIQIVEKAPPMAFGFSGNIADLCRARVVRSGL